MFPSNNKNYNENNNKNSNKNAPPNNMIAMKNVSVTRNNLRPRFYYFRSLELVLSIFAMHCSGFTFIDHKRGTTNNSKNQKEINEKIFMLSKICNAMTLQLIVLSKFVKYLVEIEISCVIAGSVIPYLQYF